MSDERSVKDLFREWRGGNAEAGQAMAQRFADWYYAIATSRLGEERGRRPCEVACEKFGEGIVSVADARSLVGWAHEIVNGEVDKAGTRATDGDEPNAFTANQSPKALLDSVRDAVGSELQLLEAVYGGRATDQQIDALAKPFGGNPLGVLRARYRVKQVLRDRHGAPFEVAPDQPILDRKPLPLYESGRMAPAEESGFEQWMISDLDLCKDIAEFAHFAIALRGGLGPPRSNAPAASRPTLHTPVQSPDNDGLAIAGLSGMALVAVGMSVFALMLVLAAAAAMFMR